MLNGQTKLAVIAGGSGYLGREIARTLSQEGFATAILYNTPSKKEEVEMFISLLPGSRAFCVDLTSEDSLEKVFSEVEDMGDLSVCILSSGTKPTRKALAETTKGELEEAFRVNVFGGFSFLSIASRILKEKKKGTLIGITTAGVAVPEASRMMSGYMVAKYALHGMLTMLHEEVKPFGVRVFSVAPGFMEGGMNSDIPKAFVEMIRLKSKTQKLTTKEDVAKRIAYLVSKEGEKETACTQLVALEYQ